MPVGVIEFLIPGSIIVIFHTQAFLVCSPKGIVDQGLVISDSPQQCSICAGDARLGLIQFCAFFSLSIEHCFMICMATQGGLKVVRLCLFHTSGLWIVLDTIHIMTAPYAIHPQHGVSDIARTRPGPQKRGLSYHQLIIQRLDMWQG